MPFTGENILHMVIVRREIEELRWILDFYHNHKFLDKVHESGGIQELLVANAKGTFFTNKKDDFYFGKVQCNLFFAFLLFILLYYHSLSYPQ